MTARSSDPSRRRGRSPSGDERGAVLAFVVLALIVILASAGLAIDLGRGYITKARLARAVDAAALAGARAFRIDESDAEARAVFRANIPADPDNEEDTVHPTVTPGTNERGEDTLAVSASQTVPTTFMTVVGINTMNVGASAVAAVPPIDIVLVLDISNSLCQAESWDDLEDAAALFVDRFDDDLDQFALVTFQLVGATHFELDQPFKDDVVGQIHALRTAGDTNIQEGLRLAREQILGDAARDSAAKVIVFFTDGVATAMRGNFGGRNRVIALPGTGSRFRGAFNDPDEIPYDGVMYVGPAPTGDVCPGGEGGENVIGGWPGDCSGDLNCFGWSASGARPEMALRGLQQADLIREEGILIYSIGLGNFDSEEVGPPDLDYLCEVANTGEIANPSEDTEDCDATVDEGQPQGKVYFAPTGDDLEQVFNDVARDLIVRLAS